MDDERVKEAKKPDGVWSAGGALTVILFFVALVMLNMPRDSEESVGTNRGVVAVWIDALDYGEALPLTEPRVLLRCERGLSRASLTLPASSPRGEITYALNGPAMQVYEDIEPIWRWNAEYPAIDGSPRIPVSDLLARALSLCEGIDSGPPKDVVPRSQVKTIQYGEWIEKSEWVGASRDAWDQWPLTERQARLGCTPYTRAVVVATDSKNVFALNGPAIRTHPSAEVIWRPLIGAGEDGIWPDGLFRLIEAGLALCDGLAGE